MGAQNKWVNHSVLKRREIDVLGKRDAVFYRIKSKNVVLNIEVKLKQHKKNLMFWFWKYIGEWKCSACSDVTIKNVFFSFVNQPTKAQLQ